MGTQLNGFLVLQGIREVNNSMNNNIMMIRMMIMTRITIIIIIIRIPLRTSHVKHILELLARKRLGTR